MTRDQLVDMVEQQFPNISETQIETMLENALKIFCEQTLIKKESVEITTIASTTAYTIPDRVLRVDSVSYNDGTKDYEVANVYGPIAENTTINNKLYAYYIHEGIINFGTLTTAALAAVDAGNTLTLNSRVKLTSLSNLVPLYDSNGDEVLDSNGDVIYVVSSTSPSGPLIPDQFHEALPYYVLQRLHALQKDFNAASYYERLYTQMRLDARRYANEYYDGHFKQIQISEMG